MALRWSHDDMLAEEIVLEDVAKFVTASDERARAFLKVGHESVEFVLIERGQIDTTRHEYGLRDLGDSLERPLNTIEDSL